MVVVDFPREVEKSERPEDRVPVYDAEVLTRDGLARIALGDQLYTLRITRAGKLILTK
ncbi:MAG: hemin uptake protein HemP [Pseudomonadota bacterium]